MPLESIPIGPSTTLTQNVVYALPAVSCEIITSLALQSSLDGTNFTAFTSGIVNGAFVRCTTGNAVVTLRKNGVI